MSTYGEDYDSTRIFSYSDNDSDTESFTELYFEDDTEEEEQTSNSGRGEKEEGESEEDSIDINLRSLFETSEERSKGNKECSRCGEECSLYYVCEGCTESKCDACIGSSKRCSCGRTMSLLVDHKAGACMTCEAEQVVTVCRECRGELCRGCLGKERCPNCGTPNRETGLPCIVCRISTSHYSVCETCSVPFCSSCSSSACQFCCSLLDRRPRGSLIGQPLCVVRSFIRDNVAMIRSSRDPVSYLQGLFALSKCYTLGGERPELCSFCSRPYGPLPFICESCETTVCPSCSSILSDTRCLVCDVNLLHSTLTQIRAGTPEECPICFYFLEETVVCSLCKNTICNSCSLLWPHDCPFCRQTNTYRHS